MNQHEMSLHPDPRYRLEAAYDPLTPGEDLIRLTKDEDAGIRASVARNPALPLLGQEAIMECVDTTMRWGLAENVGAHPDILTRLSKLDGVCRLRVAKNPSTPLDVLVELTQDTHSVAQRYAFIQLEERGLLGILSDD